MKLSITSQQQEYFEAQHIIEFVGIFSKDEISDLEANIDKTLSARLKCALEKVWREPPEKLFKAGLNLSRSNAFIMKLITSSKLSRIASQLLNQKPIRLGYDILISPNNASYLHPLRPFAEICCMQGFIGGVLICLEGEKAGNVAVFGPELQLDPAKIFEGKPFLLVTYAHPTSLYIRKLSDPLCLAMQDLGYIYGDRLTDVINPIIYK